MSKTNGSITVRPKYILTRGSFEDALTIGIYERKRGEPTSRREAIALVRDTLSLHGAKYRRHFVADRSSIVAHEARAQAFHAIVVFFPELRRPR